MQPNQESNRYNRPPSDQPANPYANYRPGQSYPNQQNSGYGNPAQNGPSYPGQNQGYPSNNQGYKPGNYSPSNYSSPSNPAYSNSTYANQAQRYYQGNQASAKAINLFDILTAIGGFLMIIICFLPMVKAQLIPEMGSSMMPNLSMSWSSVQGLQNMLGPTPELKLAFILMIAYIAVGSLTAIFALLRMRVPALVLSIIGFLASLLLIIIIIGAQPDSGFTFALAFYLLFPTALILLICPILALKKGKSQAQTAPRW